MKLLILKLGMLHLVHQELLGQILGQHVLTIIRIQVEVKTYIQNQHLFMDEFINQDLIACILEYTSFFYHIQFLKDL